MMKYDMYIEVILILTNENDGSVPSKTGEVLWKSLFQQPESYICNVSQRNVIDTEFTMAYNG